MVLSISPFNWMQFQKIEATGARFQSQKHLTNVCLEGIFAIFDMPSNKDSGASHAPREEGPEFVIYSPPGLLGHRNGRAMRGSLGTLRTVRPFWRRRQKNWLNRSCPKNGSPLNDMVGTPPCPVA